MKPSDQSIMSRRNESTHRLKRNESERDGAENKEKRKKDENIIPKYVCNHNQSVTEPGVIKVISNIVSYKL